MGKSIRLAVGALSLIALLALAVAQAGGSPSAGPVKNIIAQPPLSGGGPGPDVTLGVEIPFTLQGTNPDAILNVLNNGTGPAMFAQSASGPAGLWRSVNFGTAGVFDPGLTVNSTVQVGFQNPLVIQPGMIRALTPFTFEGANGLSFSAFGGFASGGSSLSFDPGGAITFHVIQFRLPETNSVVWNPNSPTLFDFGGGLNLNAGAPVILDVPSLDLTGGGGAGGRLRLFGPTQGQNLTFDPSGITIGSTPTWQILNPGGVVRIGGPPGFVVDFQGNFTAPGGQIGVCMVSPSTLDCSGGTVKGQTGNFQSVHGDSLDANSATLGGCTFGSGLGSCTGLNADHANLGGCTAASGTESCDGLNANHANLGGCTVDSGGETCNGLNADHGQIGGCTAASGTQSCDGLSANHGQIGGCTAASGTQSCDGLNANTANLGGCQFGGGTFSCQGVKSFRIADPLDPANKWLYHSSVESPDVMNIYNGNVTTDAKGFAVVKLPAYFEALNRDFRYQLTVIGQFAQAIVAKEIVNDQFTIRTNKPGVKVSWQVTGIRNDAYARAHPMKVEVAKTGAERAAYQNH